jgi:hypothetical protein
MKFLSKNARHKTPTFWVELYNATDKAFLLSLGFTEEVIPMPVYLGSDQKRLTYEGSLAFGLWSDDDFYTISDAICKEYGKKRLGIEQNFED